MTLWFVLGALLVVLVASVLISFFYWRPRAKQRVTLATQALAQELHGRPPELITPAQCRSADLRDGESLKGLGVLALTEQAVLYSTGERVVVLPRDGMRAESRGTRLELHSDLPKGSMVLSLPDPAAWRERLTA